MAQSTTTVAVKMKTFDTLSGAAFDKMTSAELALLSRDELIALTFRIRAVMGAIAAYITATESHAIFDIEPEAKALKMTREAIAALSKNELEHLALSSQEILRRCPFKPGNRFCSLPDEFVLDILLTWILIEDLAHFDMALLNRMDRRVHLLLLRDTEHGGIHSFSEKVFGQIKGYRFDSGVMEWLESRNVFMRALKFHDKKQDFPAGFLAKTGRKLLQIDMIDCDCISDTGVDLLAMSCPMLENVGIETIITGSREITAVGIANLGQQCPHIHTFHPLPNNGYVNGSLMATELAINYGALKTIVIKGLSDADVLRLAKGCPLLEHTYFENSAGLTDAAVLNLVDFCPGLHSLGLARCELITDAALETLAQRVPGLLSLDVSGTQVTDAGLARLAQGCRLLKKVDFAGLDISDSALARLAEACPGLKSVNVAFCERITDESITTLVQHCTRLHTIKLICTNITDISLAQLGESCGNIKKIDLMCTAITDSGLARLTEGCSRLEDVNLHGLNQITDVGAASLALHCPLIRRLLFSGKQVTDVGLERIAEGCRSLKRIFLHGLENISDVGVIKLAEGCTNLELVQLTVCDQITDAGVLSHVENCPRLYSLYCDSPYVTDALRTRLRKDFTVPNKI
jgi:hypothetical protein